MTTAPQTRAPSTDPAGTERRTPARAGADGGDFCRIAVAGPSSRVDLAVPLGVPLARLLPSLLQHAGEEPGPDGGALHDGWALRTSDGTRLEAARTLGAQQVREGHLLFLTHGTEEQPPPLYDDVVEVIGAESVRTPWPAAATRRAAGAFAAVAVLAAAGALAVAPGVLAGYLGLVTGVLGLGLAGLLSRAFADLAAGTFAAVLSAVPGAVGAMRLLGGAEPLRAGQLDASHVLLGCAVVAVFGAAGPLLVGGGDGTFAAVVVASVFAAAGAFIAVVWDAGAAPAAAVAAPLALAAVPLLPALALRLARVPGPQLASDAGGLEELPEQVGHRELRLRVDRARRLLTGMLAGCQLVVLAGALTLLAAGGLWAGVLAGALWALALLRARLFREAPQTAVSLATGLAVLLGAAVLLVADFAGEALALLAVSVPVCLAVALVACAVGLYSGRRALNPRFARLLDAAETTLLLSVVPLVLAVWGVYTALLELKA